MKTNLSDRLREADRAACDELSPAEAGAMRQRVLSAVGERHHAGWRPGLVAVGAAVLLLVGLAGRPDRRPAEATLTSVAPPGSVEPRQLQFSTPGGTRIIWVLDPDFTLQENVP